MVNIIIGEDRKPSINNLIIGNRYENNSNKITFQVPEKYDSFNKYILGTIRWKNDPISVIIPLSNNTLIISSLLTQYHGNWSLCLMCRETSIEMDTPSVDLTPTETEIVFVSDIIICAVKKGTVDSNTFENSDIDENIKVIFDDILEKIKDFEENYPEISQIAEHINNNNNPHNVTKEQLGLSKIENKTSQEILDELTKEDVVKALGFTPNEGDTYVHPTTSGYRHIPSGGTEGQFLQWESDGNAKWTTLATMESVTDDTLDENSTNTVQNKAITQEFKKVLYEDDILILDCSSEDDFV